MDAEDRRPETEDRGPKASMTLEALGWDDDLDRAFQAWAGQARCRAGSRAHRVQPHLPRLVYERRDRGGPLRSPHASRAESQRVAGGRRLGRRQKAAGREPRRDRGRASSPQLVLTTHGRTGHRRAGGRRQRRCRLHRHGARRRLQPASPGAVPAARAGKRRLTGRAAHKAGRLHRCRCTGRGSDDANRRCACARRQPETESGHRPGRGISVRPARPVRCSARPASARAPSSTVWSAATFRRRGRSATRTRRGGTRPRTVSSCSCPNGGFLIDTPGMRELQLWDVGDAVSETFDDIEALAGECRFSDCRHRDEPQVCRQGGR